MAARSCRAASSRCWRSRARCSAIRSCWSWTSRPRAWRRSSSTRSSSMLVDARRRKARWRSWSSSRTSASRPRCPTRSRSWSTAASTGSWTPRRSPPTANCSSACSASAAMPRKQPVTPAEAAQAQEQLAEVYRVDRGGAGAAEPMPQDGVYRPVTELPNRWNVPVTAMRQAAVDKTAPQDDLKKVFAIPFAERIGRTVLVVGTFDTKGKELRFIADRLKSLGMPVRTVDLSTSGKPSSADVPAMQVASMHPRGASAVFSGDRGGSVSGHGGSLRALDRARAAHRRRHLGRRLRRHHAGDGRHARAAGRHPQDHGLDGGGRRCRQICRRRRHHDVPFGRRRSGAELDHRAGARQRRARHGRHDRATARRARPGRQSASWRGRPSASPCSASPRLRCRRSRNASKPTTTASSSTPPASAGGRWRTSAIPGCSPASSTSPPPRSPT